MSSILADVALLTDRRYAASEAAAGDWYLANILRDDALLRDALAARGIGAVRVDWADPDVDWGAFDCAVFRTTWDYYERFGEFLGWLGQAQWRTRLINDPALVRWNLDKHYLGDLEASGVPVVPTRFIERGSRFSLRQAMEDAGWAEAVIKPCVSGGAWHTYRVGHHNAAEVERVIAPLLERETFMLQPFLEEVVSTGEDTLVVIGGEVTHAVRKVAKAGDFRVQDDHGGTVHELRPAPEQVHLAERALASCSPRPLYGRVDMIRDGRGEWVIMELELVEPELWLRYCPPAAERFAELLERVLREGEGS